MRLVSYDAAGHWRCGIEVGSRVVDAETAAAAAGIAANDGLPFSNTRAVVALDREQLARVAGAAAADGEGVGTLEELRLGPPVWDPEKFVCLGLNYRDHAEESGLAAPAAPMFFAKFANSLIGPTDTIVPPRATQKVDYEAELAVVVGRAGRRIAAADALDHVAGAMALNDVSARDLQLANTLWTGGKAVDTFGPCGPALVTLDEIGDIQNLGVRTRVNGATVQDGTTASMIFGVAATIEHLSQIMTLRPGDIIATGTPAGVGQSRDPQIFLREGDVVEVEIDSIGTLRNPVGPAA